MKFNRHSDIEGAHAFLGASTYSWTNYDDERLKQVWLNHQAKMKGTELHAIAASLIRNRLRQPRSGKTFCAYVNDAIGFRMDVEQPLVYSRNCFGTADAISFRNNLLRIHDLKTGVNKSSMRQLEIYAALFCLEYEYRPDEIEIVLRIYQNDMVEECIPEPGAISEIMAKIIHFDKIIEELKE